MAYALALESNNQLIVCKMEHGWQRDVEKYFINQGPDIMRLPVESDKEFDRRTRQPATDVKFDANSSDTVT